MVWFSIEFSDYGTTIVSQLSLRSLRSRSIGNLSLHLPPNCKCTFIGVFWSFIIVAVFYNQNKRTKFMVWIFFPRKLNTTSN